MEKTVETKIPNVNIEDLNIFFGDTHSKYYGGSDLPHETRTCASKENDAGEDFDSLEDEWLKDAVPIGPDNFSEVIASETGIPLKTVKTVIECEAEIIRLMEDGDGMDSDGVEEVSDGEEDEAEDSGNRKSGDGGKSSRAEDPRAEDSEDDDPDSDISDEEVEDFLYRLFGNPHRERRMDPSVSKRAGKGKNSLDEQWVVRITKKNHQVQKGGCHGKED